MRIWKGHVFMNIETIIEKYLEKKELYYVFIDLPLYWEVRAAGVWGAVYNKNQKMAMIYFHDPVDMRMVERVEWLTDKQEVYKIDYYGKYGYPYCVAYFDEGKMVSKSYYTKEHEEKLQVNLSNGVVSLYNQGCVSAIFKSEEEFIKYYNEMVGQ